MRCLESLGSVGDRPGWADQTVLRSVLRQSRVARPVEGSDLAVRMRDFVGSPQALLGALAAFAPDHVMIDGDFADAT